MTSWRNPCCPSPCIACFEGYSHLFGFVEPPAWGWNKPVCLLKLECLDIGYMKLSILLGFVKLLLLPMLKNLLVHDFDRCLETNEQSTLTHFGGVRKEQNTNWIKDMYQLLVSLIASVIAAQSKAHALVKLDMYSIMCQMMRS